MQCDLCRIREAIVHLTRMTAERKTVIINLCPACAAEAPIDDLSESRLEDLISKIRTKAGESTG